MDPATPDAPRLRFERLAATGVDVFHTLATDPHIRRYLLDDETVSREWCRAEVARSDALFEARGVGLWLVGERNAPDEDRIGFAGFRVFEEMSPEVQLLYAFVERATGRGYATECGRALLDAATGFDEMLAAVDAPNRASARVLEKLGFTALGREPGVSGDTHWFRWARSTRAVRGRGDP